LGLQIGHLDEEKMVLSYFVEKWLQFMGYGSSKNRKYFIGRVKLLAGDSQAYKFAKIYSNLHLLNLPAASLLEFLL
jgi:hypothetical protein